jgi:hypothetical protein
VFPAATRTDHGFSDILGDNEPRLGGIPILPFFNGFCRDTLKRSTTPFAEGCTVSLDDIRVLTPLKSVAFMPFLAPRELTSPFTLLLGSFEPIGGWGAATVLTIHVELPLKFSNPFFKGLDDRDNCLRIVLYQCKDLATFQCSVLNIYLSLII